MRNVEGVVVSLERVVAGAGVEGEVSPRVRELGVIFGVAGGGGEGVTLLPRFELTLRAGEVVMVTGASGGGKSTIMGCVEEALRGKGVRVVKCGMRSGGCAAPGLRSPPPNPSLIDRIGATLDDAVRWLSRAGLAEARVMVRREEELSEGQRWRWGLARAMEEAECGVRPVACARLGVSMSGTECKIGDHAYAEPKACHPRASRLTVVLADEFCSTLDRVTAAGVARSVRKWVTRSGVCFVAATSHDDLLESLEPDVLVVKGLDARVEVMERERRW